MRLRIALLILLLWAIAANAWASSLNSPEDYLALKKKLQTGIDFATLNARPGEFVGKVFELRGTLAGYSEDDNGCCLIIATPENRSFFVSTDSTPLDAPRANVVCLVRIGRGSTQSLSDLSLVACAYEALVYRPQPPKREAAQPSPPHQAANTKATSSERVTEKDLVAAYKRAIKSWNSKLSDTQADTIARSVLGFSYHYKVDPRLVCAVILAESHFSINATSRCGAQGLGQLMPTTAAGLGVNNAYDPVENVYGSVRYVKSMLDRMSGNKHWNELTWYDLALALAAYNAGPNAVKKHGGIPPYRETQDYVRKVTGIYKALCGVS